MARVNDDHQKKLEKVWLLHVEEMPDNLKEEVLNFSCGKKLQGLNLYE